MKTNKLQLDINYEKLNQDFIFLKFEWQITDKQKPQWASSYHLDDLLVNYRAEACLFQYSRFAYVMFKRSEVKDITALIRTLNDKDDYEFIKILPVQATSEITDNCITGKWLSQILFNALANFDSKYLAFHNLNGNFYYFPSGEIKNKSVTAYEIKLEDGSLLTARAVTCRQKLSVKFDDNMTGKTKNNALKKPNYRLESGILKRIFDKNDKGKDVYIFAGVGGTKAKSKALSIASVEKFQQSRFGILHHVLTRFNERFSDIVQAKWNEYEVAHSLTDRFRLLKNPPKALIARMTEVNLRLVDRIGDEASQKMCHDILAELGKLKVKAILGKNLIKGAHYLCLIKPKAYYEETGKKDAYLNSPSHSIQHLTDEGYENSSGKDKLLQNLIKELWIKQDIVDGQFQLAKDAMPNVSGNWVFGNVFGKDEDEACHCVEITPDGKLTHFEHEKSVLFQSHDYTNEVLKFLTFFYNDKNNQIIRRRIESFVITPDKSVNVIIRTNEVIVPKFDLISGELKQVGRTLTKAQTPENIANYLRNKESTNDCQKFIDKLESFDEKLNKKMLNKLLKDCYKVQSREYKEIRQVLIEMGIYLSFSKSKESLYEKMGDLFDIHASMNNEKSALYAVGYYFDSLKMDLDHTVHLREVRCLSGKNTFEEILPWLDVDFVGFNKQTVIPFPMKYLREMLL